MTSKRGNFERKIIHLLIILIIAFFFLPFVLFGNNSVITIHDNLDGIVPYYKMFHDNGLFFKFDALTKGYDEMSTLFITMIGFYFQNILYWLFSDFTAYALSYGFSVCFGFISMYILLKKAFGFSSTLSIFIAICYALLPVIPAWNIAIGTLPLIMAIFHYFAFKKSNTLSWKILFLLFFPFFSFFATIGIFILGFWFFGLVTLGIKDKKINLNLLVGFILLCIGYVLVDLRLFYVMFVLKTPLNRSIYSYPVGIIIQIKQFLRSLWNYTVEGYYHAASFQRKIIIPFAFLVSLSCLITLIRRVREKTGTITARIKLALAETDVTVKQLFIVEFTVFVFCCIAALYESGLLAGFIRKFIPLLFGFNWGRVWIFNRVLWYVIFALCLQLILRIDMIALDLNLGRSIERVKLSRFFPKLIAGILVSLQIGYITFTPVDYNDQVKTWRNETIIKTGIYRKLLSNTIFFRPFPIRNSLRKDCSTG